MPETPLDAIEKSDWVVTKAWGGPICLVTRVARDGSWVDIKVQGGGETWGKRMRRETLIKVC